MKNQGIIRVENNFNLINSVEIADLVESTLKNGFHLWELRKAFTVSRTFPLQLAVCTDWNAQTLQNTLNNNILASILEDIENEDDRLEIEESLNENHNFITVEYTEG
jgi:hypothetical protein